MLSRFALPLFLLAVAACHRQPGAAPTVQASAAVAKPTGCADALPLTLADDSFVASDNRPFAPARLAQFRVSVTTAFRKAAAHACKTTPAVRRELAKIKTVSVDSASGATEPTFYQDEPGAVQLNFQQAFNEADLELPPRKEIELGLRCWADPDRDECADRGD